MVESFGQQKKYPVFKLFTLLSIPKLGLQRSGQRHHVHHRVDQKGGQRKDEDKGKVLPEDQRPLGDVLHVLQALVEKVVPTKEDTLPRDDVPRAELQRSIGGRVRDPHKVLIELKLPKVQRPAGPVVEVEPVEVVGGGRGGHHRADGGAAQ